MKRPFLSIEQNNLLFYIIVGTISIFSALLSLFLDNPAIYFLSKVVNMISIILLTFLIVSRKERDDEMTTAHRNRAICNGFFAALITCLLLLLCDSYLPIPFYFAGNMILGTGLLSTGYFFWTYEK